MAVQNGDEEPQWIKSLKSGGAVPCLDPDNCLGGWSSPPGESFMVRGPHYTTDKVKIPGGAYALKSLGFDWLKGPSKIFEVLNDKNNRFGKAINEVSSGNPPFVLAINLQLPGKDNHSAIMYFASVEPVEEDSLLNRFLKGDDSFRSQRLKMIANVVDGPWVVRKAVGEQAICILGRVFSIKYVHGRNFLEVDIDIGSNIVANAVVHVAFGYIKNLTLDMAFVIEGQTESELPEKLLGAIRFAGLDAASAEVHTVPPEEKIEEAPTFLPVKLFRSVGLGISHFLKSSGPGDSASSSENVNGTLQR